MSIIFYDAAYWPSFGSIFPIEDISSLIPEDEADVAILEEPEHLNWFPIPSIISSSSPGNPPHQKNNEVPSCTPNKLKEATEDKHKKKIQYTKKNHQEGLGWMHKFNFVVGIIHTNYTAYMKEFGIGTSIVAAPVINAMSALVVRAYCHRVNRLSEGLPTYARWKEVTCNVHGVRSDFLDQRRRKVGFKSNDMKGKYSPVYFIGKLLWAKGFDQMLKLQDLYRKGNDNSFFPIDIYGTGPDEIAIKKAFHGRTGKTLSSNRNMTKNIWTKRYETYGDVIQNKDSDILLPPVAKVQENDTSCLFPHLDTLMVQFRELLKRQQQK